MTEDQRKVSEALERFLESYLSPTAVARIAADYGQEITAQVKAVYDDAMNAPVNWQTAKMDDALEILHRYLDVKYPWLSAKARTKLNYAYIMAWK